MRQSQSLFVERLENRRLMSATAAVVDGILSVTGTESKDAIVFSLNATDSKTLNVQIGKETSSFDLGTIESVRISAGEGADRILVNEKNGAIFLAFKVDAGAGNDTIVTGSGNDVIVAGEGTDKVTGGAGDDQIDGGNGNDKLVGGQDNDLILAGAGKDKLSGGTGNDNLDGGGGKDALTSGTGNDEIAVDDSNTKELKDSQADRTDDGAYVVTAVSAELTALHEEVVPGSHVVRVEEQGAILTAYYQFDGDLQVYRTVIDHAAGDFELVTREISPNEIRLVARNAFAQVHPGAEVLSIFQRAHGFNDVRYRDADGVVQEVQTTDFAWTLDDAENDVNNDGIYNDNEQGGGGPNHNEGDGGQNGDHTQNGDGGNGDPNDQTGPQDNGQQEPAPI